MRRQLSIMGLDLSLRSSGIVTLDLYSGEIVDARRVRTTPKLDHYQCIDLVAAEVRQVRSLTAVVDVWVEEGIAFHSGTTTRILARVQGGVIQKALTREPGFVNVSEVKRLAGAQLKEDILEKAQAKWGVDEIENHDVADAAFVAEYGRLMYLDAMASSA